MSTGAMKIVHFRTILCYQESWTNSATYGLRGGKMILLITPLRSTFCKLFITEAKRYH